MKQLNRWSEHNVNSDYVTNSYIQDKFDKMLNLQSRLGDWEVIQPGRELLKEGELVKISRKREDIRYLILLTDCLLYTSYTGNLSLSSASLRVSYTIPLSHLQVRVSHHLAEFSMTSSVRSCTLRAR